MTANLRRVDYYTADQFARFSWWQRRRIRQRRAQAVIDAAHRHGQCWQANHPPPIDHDPEQRPTAAPEGHRLRCRCNCHTTSPHDHGLLF